MMCVETEIHAIKYFSIETWAIYNEIKIERFTQLYHTIEPCTNASYNIVIEHNFKFHFVQIKYHLGGLYANKIMFIQIVWCSKFVNNLEYLYLHLHWVVHCSKEQNVFLSAIRYMKSQRTDPNLNSSAKALLLSGTNIHQDWVIHPERPFIRFIF